MIFKNGRGEELKIYVEEDKYTNLGRYTRQQKYRQYKAKYILFA